MFFLGFSCYEKFVQERLVGFYVFRALALTPDGTTRERGKGDRGKRPRETEREKGEREKAQGRQWCGEREREREREKLPRMAKDLGKEQGRMDPGPSIERVVGMYNVQFVHLVQSFIRPFRPVVTAWVPEG